MLIQHCIVYMNTDTKVTKSYYEICRYSVEYSDISKFTHWSDHILLCNTVKYKIVLIVITKDGGVRMGVEIGL